MLENLRIRTLIALLGLVSVLGLGVVALVGYMGTMHIIDVMAAKDDARHADVAFKTEIQEWKNILIRGGNEADFKKYSAARLESSEEVKSAIADLVSHETLEEEFKIRARAFLADYIEMDKKYAEALKDYQSVGMAATDARVRGIDRQITQQLTALTRDLKDEVDHALREDIEGLVISITVISIITILIAVYIARVVGNGLSALVDSNERLRTGDLRVSVDIRSRNELGELGSAFNQMVIGLRGITESIGVATDRLSSTVSEVRSAMLSQTAGASEQAAAVTQMMTTIEEIRTTSQQTIDRASELGMAAQQSREESDRGQEAFGAVLEDMSLIRERVEEVAVSILEFSKRTQQIGEITEAVETLAVQSKMLALNASIEAAKAGEAGFGFAVVAEEIRSLAEESQESTAQVKSILQDIQRSADNAVMVTEESTKQVAQGVTKVEEMGQVMDSLGEVVEQTTTASLQIVTIVRQEAAGIKQIAQSINDISSASNNMVTASQQTENAVDGLAVLSDQLRDQIQVYKL